MLKNIEKNKKRIDEIFTDAQSMKSNRKTTDKENSKKDETGKSKKKDD